MLRSLDRQDHAHQAAAQCDDVCTVGLATAAAHGDQAAFEDLYSIFSQRVFNLVLRSVHDRGTAEDLCQEIWLKVHQEIHRLRDVSAFRTWLYRIASRACIDFARSSRAAHASNEELIEDFVQATDPIPEDAAISGSQVRMVWETLATMAPRQSIALYLKQVEGRSYEEIGSILNCSRETVESLLFRARQSFPKAYDRVQSSPLERCALFQHVVAGILDDEPTQVQKSAIHAHMQECRACRTQLPDIAAAAKGYSLLPLLPFTKGIALQAVLAGGVTGTAIVAPATTGGVIAGLSLKAKLAALFGLLAMGATGAATTTIVNVPLVPDVGAIFREDAPRDGDTQVVARNQGAGVGQQGANTGAGVPVDANASTSGAGASAPDAGHRDPGASGEDGPGGYGISGSQPSPPASPAAMPSGDEGGASPGPGGPEVPAGGPLEEPIDQLDDLTGAALGNTLAALDGTLEGIDGTLGSLAEGVDGALGDLGETVGEVLDPIEPVLDALLPGDALDNVVDDTLDTLLPPEGDEEGPVGDILDDVDGALDDVLPGEGEDSGLLGGLLDPVLPPSATQPPASTPAPEATQPPDPPCLLGILC